MPQITKLEAQLIRKFSNKLFDFIHQDLNCEEKRADQIAEEIITVLIKRIENR